MEFSISVSVRWGRASRSSVWINVRPLSSHWLAHFWWFWYSGLVYRLLKLPILHSATEAQQQPIAIKLRPPQQLFTDVHPTRTEANLCSFMGHIVLWGARYGNGSRSGSWGEERRISLVEWASVEFKVILSTAID